MKVIICGAGVAGLTLAARLATGGWQVLLLNPSLGAQTRNCVTDLFGTGYDAAERLGLISLLADLRYTFADLVWVETRGRAVAQLKRRRMERVLGSRVMTLLRSDLEAALLGALPRAVTVSSDARIEEIRFDGSGVRVRLGSGQSERADLLIGADGPHSRVRNLMLGDRELPFRFLGVHAAGFVFEDAQIADQLEGQCRILTVPNRQASLYPLRGGRIIAQFVHRGASTALPADPVSELNRTYRALGWLLPDVLDHARRLPGIYYDYVGQIHLRRWSFGRVVLAGDACQSTSPLAEDGSSSALHGASVLADRLLRTTTIEAALAEYEGRVKPAVEERQAVAVRAAPWLLPASTWRLSLRNLIVRMANHPGMGWMIKPVIA